MYSHPQKYIDIDIYGTCGSPCPGDLCHNDSPMTDYRFYLSFENSFCTDYITEKFFKQFYRDRTVVPVVRGGGDYDRYFDPGTFINAAHFRDPRSLALYLKKLSGDQDAYFAVLERKMRYVQLWQNYQLRWRTDFHCSVCELLNKRRPEVRSYYDVVEWAQDKRCWPAPDDRPKT